MKDFGSQFSTTEGWGAVLLMLLTLAKTFGWIQPETDLNTLVMSVGQLVLAAIAFIAIAKKAFRKGSVPFVADAPKQP